MKKVSTMSEEGQQILRMIRKLDDVETENTSLKAELKTVYDLLTRSSLCVECRKKRIAHLRKVRG